MTNNNFAEWVNIKDRKPKVNGMYVVKYKRTSLSDERTITLQWKDDSFYQAESLIDAEYHSFYWLQDNAAVTRFEVIDHTGDANSVGRILTKYNVKITMSLQDEGRTCKIFLDK